MLKTFTFCLSFFIAGPVLADRGAESTRHSVVGLLSLKKGEPVKLIINPTHPERYTLHVQNREWVEKLVKGAEYLGLVRVEIAVEAAPKLARVLKLEPARVRRVPLYDSELKALVRGDG